MITRLRAASITDAHGNTIRDWTTPGTLDLPGATSWPVTTRETIGPGREAIIDTWMVAIPPGTDVDRHDRISIDGQVWQIDGWPQPWANPFTGARGGFTIRVVQVGG